MIPDQTITSEIKNGYQNNTSMEDQTVGQRVKRNRVNVFRNGERNSGRVMFVSSEQQLEDFLTLASSLFFSKEERDNNMQFHRIFNIYGGEIAQCESILPDDTIYLSQGEEFIPQNSTDVSWTHEPNARGLRDKNEIPSRKNIHAVLKYFASLVENREKEELSSLDMIETTSPISAPRAQFIADYETFCQDVRPIIERYKDGDIDAFLSSLYDIFNNHCATMQIEDRDIRPALKQPLITSHSSTAITATPIPVQPTQQASKVEAVDTGKTKTKRALTGFNLFYRDKCKEFRETQHDPSLPNENLDSSGRIAPRIAKAWKQLTEDERRAYHEQARARQQQQLLSIRDSSSTQQSSTPADNSYNPSFSKSGKGSSSSYRFYNYTPAHQSLQPYYQPTQQQHVENQIPSISSLAGEHPSSYSFPSSSTSFATTQLRNMKRVFDEIGSGSSADSSNVSQLPPMRVDDSSQNYQHHSPQQYRSQPLQHHSRKVGGESNQYQPMPNYNSGVGSDTFLHRSSQYPPPQHGMPPYDDMSLNPNKKQRFM